MKKLAAFYRKSLDIKVVGITGSVGKTSTKEMISSVLEQKYSVHKTAGNFNNEIGLPLTIFGIRESHQVAVLEMGISDFGEMHRLSTMSCPDVMVITNIGYCHLEFLGDRDGVLKAKTECFEHIQCRMRSVLNADDDKLATVQTVNGKPAIYYGKESASGVHKSVYTTNIENLGLSGKPIIALVAGSRSQELKHVLPKMLTMVKHFPDHEFVIAGAPSMSDADYAPYLQDVKVRIIYGQTYRLVRQARAALVTSGTATLETAILRTPQVVCYSGEGGALSYFLFKTFVKVKYISLVNLIAGREVVTELLMQKLNEKNLLRELSLIVSEGEKRDQMLAGYDEVNEKLGDAGASERFARMMIDELSRFRG